MDETTILSLIAEGESKRVDFKRELNLDSAKDKAEFIKDIIGLANSSPDVGYLLIGIDDDKYIVGSSQLPEEQIQQIVYTYISPTLDLRCFSLPMKTPTLPLVGIIEVRATDKPHKVTRAIDKLNQDDVFVRRGSVVAKASPEEIITMHNSSGAKHGGTQKPTNNEEKTIRLDRVRLFNYSWEERKEDLEWLKANTDGYELGEVLYWEVEGWESRYEESVGRKAKPLLDKAIDLGYKSPEVYYLRAEANNASFNYGLALQDIDEAINKSRSYDANQVRYLALKAEILLEMNKVNEAFEVLFKGRELDQEELRNWLCLIDHGFDDSLLCRYMLEYEFGNHCISEPMNMALKVLALWKGRVLQEFTIESNSNITIKTQLHYLEKKVPGILRTVREILGERLWNLMVKDREIPLVFNFPTIKEQLPKDL